MMCVSFMLRIASMLFLRYVYMLKVRLCMHETQSCQGTNLSQPLTADSVIPIPCMVLKFQGLFLVARSFGGHLLVAFVEQRGLPNFFLTLTAYDGWPQV